MILNSKDTTVAYRCPVCGKNIISIVGIFALSGDMIKLKCDCSQSELVISYTSDRKIRLTVPCLVCPNPHNYVIGANSFFERELFTLSCTYSDIDICFIGTKDQVLEALKRSDEELMKMLSEAGYDDYDVFSSERDAYQGGERDYWDPEIEEIVRFVLRELEDDKKIHCGCEDGECESDFEFEDEDVRIFCTKCGYEKRVPMSSTLTANVFLHTDELTLEKKD